MKEKCTKFEGLFVFSNKDFKDHIETCENCKAEYEKFNKISELIQEAKPLYFKQKAKKSKLKTVAAMFLIIFTGSIFAMFNPYYGGNSLDGEILSAEDYGFPVDEYGLIMVDE